MQELKPKYKPGDLVKIRYKDEWHVGMILDHEINHSETHGPFKIRYEILDMILNEVCYRSCPENICYYAKI